MEHESQPPVSVNESSRVSDSAANSTSHVLSQQGADKSIITMHPEQALNSSELAAKTTIQAENGPSLEKTGNNSQSADVDSAHRQKPVLKRFVDNLASNLAKPFAQDSNKSVQVDPGERAHQGTPKQASKRPGQEFYDLEVITSPENTPPQVDVVAVYDFADGIHLRRLSKDPVIDDADRGKQQSPLSKAQAADQCRNSIDKTDSQSRSGPLTDTKYLETEQDANLSLSTLHTHRGPSNEDIFASHVRQDPSLIDTTHPTEKQEQMHEQQRSRLSDVRTWSSRQSSEVHNVDWGRDAKMLRSEIPNARILAYPYRSLKPDDSSAPANFLSDIARHLILQLANKRAAKEYSTVPIIFVGHDFGCLILQKMIALLNSSDEIEANINSRILGLTAGTIFLDALPHPLGHETQSKDGVSDQETYWMLDHSSSGREAFINAKKVWEDFLYITESKMVPVVCFHVETTQLLGQDPPGALYKTSRHKIKLYKRSSRRDPDYQNLIDQIKGCLAFKLSSDILLAENLSLLFKEEMFPESTRDYRGQTPLHWAALNQNLNAVELLITRMQNMAIAQDRSGHTPLHLAVIQASKIENPTDEEHTSWKNVICELMKGQIEVDIKDKKGKSAWDYADDKKRKWVKRIKNDRGWVTGLSTETNSESWEPLDNPKDARLSAYRKIEAGLFEFFWDPKFGEKLNVKNPTILRLLYKEKEEGLREGLEKILSSSRPPNLKSRCRWIHLPANNEQWIHDLFIKLGIRDNSMNGQRYQGRQEYARHMIAQARLYQHSRKKTNQQTNDHSAAEQASNESQGLGLPSSSHVNTVLDVDFKTSDSVNIAARAESESSVNSPQPDTVADTAFVVFMPILGFETHRNRKYLARAIKGETKGDDEGHSSLLVRGYLHDEKAKHLKPIHCRRTLDQFSYYMLDSTESRDMDQVMYRWAKKWREQTPAKDRPILMVDQLWLWVLNDGTVITSFPDTWNSGEHFSLISAVQNELINKQRPFIKSSEDVAHMVLRTSIDFFNREGPLKSKVQESFLSSINDISEKHAMLFKSFKDIIKTLADEELDQDEKTERVKDLLMLDEETEYLSKAIDIQDELTIANSVLTQQKEVLEKMLSFYPKEATSTTMDQRSSQLTSDNYYRDERSSRSQGAEQKEDVSKLKEKQVHWVDQSENALQGNENNNPDASTKTSATSSNQIAFENHTLMIENIGIVNKNIMVVKDMTKHAEHVTAELNHLLSLKQLQANAWEARSAREGSEETRKQSNTILVFTLVTIIFLPLSFLSSFFALSIDSFPKDPQTGNTAWPLNLVAGYVFGITAALSIIFVVLAFKANSIRSWYKAKFRPLKKSTKEEKPRRVKGLKVHNEPEDSDKEHSGQEDHLKAKEPDSESSIRGMSDLGPLPSHPKYAPLFGTFTFHTAIPGARKLWKYEYRHRKDEDGDSILSKDYPLHRYLVKATKWIRAYLKKPVPPDGGTAVASRRLSGEHLRRFTSPSALYGVDIGGATLSVGVSLKPLKHRPPFENIVVVDSDASSAYTDSSSYLDDYSSNSPSDHDGETRTTKQRPPSRSTSKVGKRARATALVNPMLRLVRRRRRARKTDIEARESSSLSESDIDF